MKIVFAFLVFPFVILSGCSVKNDKNKRQPEKDKIFTRVILQEQNGEKVAAADVFHLEVFKKIPDTIEGCSGGYTYDTAKNEEVNNLFLTKTNEFAIIKVKGQTIFLQMDTTNSKELSKGNYKEIYKGSEYTAILTLKLIKDFENEELATYAGTLEVFTDKFSILIRIRGSSGC